MTIYGEVNHEHTREYVLRPANCILLTKTQVFQYLNFLLNSYTGIYRAQILLLFIYREVKTCLNMQL